MKIQAEHRFAATRRQVWDGLLDPQVLADAIPGLRSLAIRGADDYDLVLTVGVGSIRGVYEGRFTIGDRNELSACAVNAQAMGTPGSVEVQATMTLDDLAEGGTLMRYEADATVTGTLAGVGQRMLAAASKRTTREFLEALDRRLVDGPRSPATDEAGGMDSVQSAQTVTASPSPSVLQPSDARVRRPEPQLDRLALGALAGFVMALVGVAVGRASSRPR